MRGSKQKPIPTFVLVDYKLSAAALLSLFCSQIWGQNSKNGNLLISAFLLWFSLSIISGS
jgi:hypothetical protein